MSLKVLLLENVHPCAKEALIEEGFTVDSEKAALSEKQLNELLPLYQVVGIRSKTHLPGQLFAAHPHLLAVGAFCIGTNQIDLGEANLRGIPVFNAPYSNTRSVAEMVIAEMIALSRQLGDANTAAHRGEWMKSSKGSYEVRGKTLGIVGYGHIGTQVSVMAEALGLRVVFFDIVKKLPLGNARSMDSLEELLSHSDFVSLHVPETQLTKNMMGKSQFEKMRKGSFLINASRGNVVDIGALASALKSGHVAGAAVDVFPDEPQSNDDRFQTELQGLKNVILTPHIGGSTEEAQEAIGREVSQSLIWFLKFGVTLGSVNFPQVNLPPKSGGQRLINVHRNVPGVLGEINGIVSRIGVNIKAQYLSTDSKVGYVVVDIEADTPQVENVFKQVSQLPVSIKTRMV
jgi:D-3-phosphoglycerate dehydrogenase